MCIILSDNTLNNKNQLLPLKGTVPVDLGDDSARLSMHIVYHSIGTAKSECSLKPIPSTVDVCIVWLFH